MKKTILLFASIAIMTSTAIAQKNKKTTAKNAVENTKIVTPAPAVPAPTVQEIPGANNMQAEAMKFSKEEHNFGTIPEGPAVTYEFEFKNTGKEPIILSNVQASCGCTTPGWTKEPIAPGKTSKITATYNTQGRPNSFTKTITVNSNIGSKVLKIQGVVEPAPTSSVPANTNSMMKH